MLVLPDLLIEEAEEEEAEAEAAHLSSLFIENTSTAQCINCHLAKDSM